MNRNSKKGFTIVELIIVIAVIAVLAAVLIPTFSNLIQKANEAKDTALVSNLNKAVAMDTSKNETVYDVLTTVRENAGYDVGKINAAATNNEILWDSANNCFVYSVNGEIKYIPDTKTKDVEGDYDYWKISSNQKDIADGNYSIYWNGEALSKVTVKTGFDAGTAEVAEVNYDRQNESVGRKVTIRTNGGALTVNAPNDTVAHYYKASGVQITAVYGNSYHEHGEVVGDIVIAEGRIELAATAQVGTVLVASKKTGDVKVDVVSGAQVGTVAPTTDAAQEDVKASATIPTESKVETKVETNSDFAGGLGTERSPYLIATAEQFYNISKLFVSSRSNKSYSFKQVANIEINKGATYYFSGTYDGGGYAITASDDVTDRDYINIFGIPYGNVVFKNIKTYSAEKVALSLSIENWYTLSSIKFSNVDIYAKEGVELVKTSQANFAYYMVGAAYTDNDKQTYEFENCNVYANLYGVNRCAAYLGATLYTDNLYIKMRNCINKANISSPQWAAVVAVNGYEYAPDSFNGNNISKFFDIDSSVKNEGVISGNYNNTHSGLVGVVMGKNEFTKALHEYSKTIGGKYDVVISSAQTDVKLYWDNGFKVLGGEKQNTYGVYIGDVSYDGAKNSRAGGVWAEKVAAVSSDALLVNSITIVGKTDSAVQNANIKYDYVFDGIVACGFTVVEGKLYCVIDATQVVSDSAKVYLTMFSNGSYTGYSVIK